MRHKYSSRNRRTCRYDILAPLKTHYDHQRTTVGGEAKTYIAEYNIKIEENITSHSHGVFRDCGFQQIVRPRRDADEMSASRRGLTVCYGKSHMKQLTQFRKIPSVTTDYSITINNKATPICVCARHKWTKTDLSIGC